jgi:hypothetical protein
MARNRRLKGGEGEEKEAAANSEKAPNSETTELSPKVKEIAEKVEALNEKEGKQLAALLTTNASKKSKEAAAAPAESKEGNAAEKPKEGNAPAPAPAEPKEADASAPPDEKPAETKGGSRRRRRRHSKKRKTRHRPSRVRA